MCCSQKHEENNNDHARSVFFRLVLQTHLFLLPEQCGIAFKIYRGCKLGWAFQVIGVQRQHKKICLIGQAGLRMIFIVIFLLVIVSHIYGSFFLFFCHHHWGCATLTILQFVLPCQFYAKGLYKIWSFFNISLNLLNNIRKNCKIGTVGHPLPTLVATSGSMLIIMLNRFDLFANSPAPKSWKYPTIKPCPQLFIVLTTIIDNPSQ